MSRLTPGDAGWCAQCRTATLGFAYGAALGHETVSALRYRDEDAGTWR